MPHRTVAAPIALALFAGLGLQDTLEGPSWSFSDGPLSAARAAHGAAAAPLDAEAPVLPAGGDVTETDGATWSEWARRVERAAARALPEEVAADRLWLAVLAREQGRDDDAWEHLAYAQRAGASIEAVLPLFVPGVPRELTESALRGLPDGVQLAPALPPPAGPAAEVVLGTGRPRPGFARVEGLRVGAAVVDMSITVESDGVQVDLTHVSGGAATLSVLLPEAPDFELRSEYVDWERQEGPRAPRTLELAPGDEPHTLFGRFRHRKVEWPNELPGELSAALADPGLRLVSRGPAPSDLAAALRALLGIPVQTAGPQLGELAFAGVTVDLSDEELRPRKLAGIVSLAERFCFARRP